MAQTCASCGHQNPLGSNFCGSCGASIGVRADNADTQAMEPLVGSEESPVTEPQGMFVVRQGPKAGSRIMLDGPATTIGRHPESDIFLDDVTVSRRHAEVRRAAGVFEVIDAGSLNGTYVNRDRVDASILNDGDELQVGKFKLVYVALESP